MSFSLPVPGGKMSIPYIIAVIGGLMISASVLSLVDTYMSSGVHVYENTQSNLLEKEGIIDEYLL